MSIQLLPLLSILLCIFISGVRSFMSSSSGRSNKHHLTTQVTHQRSSVFSLNGSKEVEIRTKLKQQATWNLVDRSKKDATVLDVLSVLCRFNQRQDFYAGEGYQRQAQLLTAERFYNIISSRKASPKTWPKDDTGRPFGQSSMSTKEFQELQRTVAATPPSVEGALAIFVSISLTLKIHSFRLPSFPYPERRVQIDPSKTNGLSGTEEEGKVCRVSVRENRRHAFASVM